MKVRNFYPRSAIRKLTEKSPATLTGGEKTALKFAMRKGRKHGVQVVVASSDLRSLEGASKEQVAAILANCNTKIFLNSPERDEWGLADTEVREQIYAHIRQRGI